MEPTMLYYDPSGSGVNLTIGKDAGYYHRDQPNAVWNQDRQPYGYAGVRRLFETLTEKVCRREKRYERTSEISDTLCTGSVRSCVSAV